MKDTIRLGRIGGVGIGVNWSLLVVAALLAFGLAHNRLPIDAPGATGTAYDLAGAVTAVALLVAVLLHELGHAVVARRAGMAVDGITLSWLGGITRIEGDAATPRIEFAIAAIGPAVSLAVGGALWGVRYVASANGVSALIVAALGWLAVINVALAVFNLVPASPLDGGRILHAAVWVVSGDRTRATKVASRAGIGLGALMVAYAFTRILTPGGEANGVVLAVLGLWIASSARTEEQAGVIHAALDHLRVADLMRPVGAAPGWVTVRTFIEHYDSPHPGWVWLLERWGGDGFDGLVAGESLRMLPPHDWDRLRPADLAVSADLALPARPGEIALDALRRTNGSQILLVVESGRTVGAVLPGDVEGLLRTGQRPLIPPSGATAAGAGQALR